MPCQYIRLGLARQIKEIMKTIDDIWRLLNPQGEFKRRRCACERLWQGYGQAKQEEIQMKDQLNMRDNETKILVATIAAKNSEDDGIQEPEYSQEAKDKLMEQMRAT